MSAITTILLGAVALTNVALVAYLLGDRNKAIKSPPGESSKLPKAESSQEQPSKVEAKSYETQSRVGASKFNVDEFLQKFEKLEQGVLKLNQTLDRIEGEVKLKDVEFANEEDKPSEEEIAKDNAETDNSVEPASDNKSDMQVPLDKLDETFQDARIEDFEGDTVSSPSASGSSIEDIEESVNAAIDPNATVENKAQAAKTLCPLLDTNLMAAAEEKIKQDILACVKEYLRSEVAEKTKPKSQPAPKQNPTTRPLPKPKKEFRVSDNLDDFNPADLIPN